MVPTLGCFSLVGLFATEAHGNFWIFLSLVAQAVETWGGNYAEPPEPTLLFLLSGDQPPHVTFGHPTQWSPERIPNGNWDTNSSSFWLLPK